MPHSSGRLVLQEKAIVQDTKSQGNRKRNRPDTLNEEDEDDFCSAKEYRNKMIKHDLADDSISQVTQSIFANLTIADSTNELNSKLIPDEKLRVSTFFQDNNPTPEVLPHWWTENSVYARYSKKLQTVEVFLNEVLTTVPKLHNFNALIISCYDVNNSDKNENLRDFVRSCGKHISCITLLGDLIDVNVAILANYFPNIQKIRVHNYPLHKHTCMPNLSTFPEAARLFKLNSFEGGCEQCKCLWAKF